MPIEPNYSTKFCQSELLQFACSNKETAARLADNIVCISNIYQSSEGICKGLAHAYIAYENNQLGSAFINLLNEALILANPPLAKHNLLENQITLAQKELAFKLIKKHYIDALKLQINHIKAHYYNQISKYISKIKFDEIKAGETNLDYITNCLIKYNSIFDMTNRYGLCFEEQQQVVTELYNKIKAGTPILSPEMLQTKKDIYTKIKEEQSLTSNEIKLFLKDAYHYCELLHELKTTEFNAKAGIIYNNYKPLNAYENIHHKQKMLSKYELKNEINRTVALKKDFFTLYVSKNHAMAFTAKYIERTDAFSFSFFEPNKGVMTTHNKSEFLDIINNIDMDNHDSKITSIYKHPIEKDKETIIGKQFPLQKDTKNPQRLTLQTIQHKDIHILAKTQLVKDKIAITLNNESKLTFINYAPLNDELTLSLSLGNRIFTIYSELNDLNKTREIINDSLHEWLNYIGENIYIDWKGQILNRLLKR